MGGDIAGGPLADGAGGAVLDAPKHGSEPARGFS
jgi:hypothetical protein